jgi:integrase/recombinase XerD
VLLRQTKAGKSRRVYFSSVAWAEIELMRGLRKGQHPFVYPGRAANTPVLHPHRVFHTALDAAKISDFRIHDLRHTFASHMVQSGATLFEVQTSLGHASSQMTARYSHLNSSGLRNRAEIAAQRLTGTDG